VAVDPNSVCHAVEGSDSLSSLGVIGTDEADVGTVLVPFVPGQGERTMLIGIGRRAEVLHAATVLAAHERNVVGVEAKYVVEQR
jgi:hypothetical protein